MKRVWVIEVGYVYLVFLFGGFVICLNNIKVMFYVS